MESRPAASTIARAVGGLFLLSTLAYMAGSGMITAVLAGPGERGQIDAHHAGLAAGVLLQFVNDAAVVAIGVLLFPILRQHSERAALGYLAARVLECGLLALGGVFALMLPGAADAAALLAGRSAAYQGAMIALALGSLPACAALYRARLIPRPLAALGLAGYAALLAGTALEVSGLDLHFLHTIPGGVFELVLPIWLLARGFSAAAGGTARPGQHPAATA